MNTENQRHTRLQKLSNSDFEIADGQPDIRGWKVKDGMGKQLGKAEELIFDYQSRKVRYIVVDLSHNDYNMDKKEVLVPIGIAELHKEEDDIVLAGVSADQLKSLPEYNEDRFDTSHENDVRNVFGGLGNVSVTRAGDPDFYEHEHFNDENLYRNRRGGRSGDDMQSPGKPDSGGNASNNWLRSKNVDQ